MEKKKRKVGMDLGRVLLWSAVLVEAPRWAGAMLAADVSTVPDWLSVGLNVLNTISGIAMGIVIVVATAYLLDALRQTKPTITIRRKNETIDRPNFRFHGLVVFIVGLLVLTPFVLGPYIVSRMMGETIATVLAVPFWRYAWAVTVVIAPAFVVGGVAFAQPGLVKVSENEAKVSEGDTKISSSVSEGNRKAENDSKLDDNLPETFGKWRDWRDLPENERLWIAKMPNWKQVRDTYGVQEKTAQNWLKRAKELYGEGIPVGSFGEQSVMIGDEAGAR